MKGMWRGMNDGHTWTLEMPDMTGCLQPTVPAILQKTRGPEREEAVEGAFPCGPARCVSVCRSPIASAFLIDLAFLS